MKDPRALPKKPRGKRTNLLKVLFENLQHAFKRGKGCKKHEDKQANGGKPPLDKIYTHTTLKTYKRALRCFIRFIKATGQRFHSLEEIKFLLEPFVAYMIAENFSAWTIATYTCGVCKALGISSAGIRKPSCRIEDIKRSREHGNEDYVRSKAKVHRKLVLFCLCVGPRKNKELRFVCGSHLRIREGVLYIYIPKGKNGQTRHARIIGSEREIQVIIQMCREAGNELLFRKIPSDLDVHALRALYACRVYLAFARAPAQLPESESFRCRGVRKGQIADMTAMRISAESLGHHRVGVIDDHYFWPLEAVKAIDFSFLVEEI